MWRTFRGVGEARPRDSLLCYRLVAYGDHPEAAASWHGPNADKALSIPHHRRLLSDDELATNDCLVGTLELFDHTVQFFKWSTMYFVYVLPLPLCNTSGAVLCPSLVTRVLTYL